MTNAINLNYLRQYQSAGLFGKNAATATATTTTTATKTDDTQNLLSGYTADTNVEISNVGRDALTNLQSDKPDEEKLSAKAQSYLEGLRKKYGDYDFVVSDTLDTSKTAGNTKDYSVILTTEEIEKMAEDEDYAKKVMGQVGDAVDILNNLSEKDLGEGVQFSQLAVSFDSEGNMKLFAQLEKLSADQQERLEEAKEKRAEEKKAAEAKSKETQESQGTQEDDESTKELTSILFKGADVEASSEEELLAKIFAIDWNKIAEQEAFI